VSETSCYRRTSHLAWRRIGDELVVVNLAAKEMIGLDATAGVLFERLVRARTPAALAELFEGDAGRCADAIVSFCRDLVAIGLLEPVEGDDPRDDDEPTELPWSSPKVLWREPLTAVVNQASPPPALGNPQCGY